MAAIWTNIKSHYFGGHFYLVRHLELVLVSACHLEKLQLRVKSTCNHTLAGFIVSYFKTGLLEGVKVIESANSIVR